MENKKWDFFISHNSADNYIVEPIVNKLRNIGFECWFDRDNNNPEFISAFAEGILNSKKFLLFLSNNAINGEYTNLEIKRAFDFKSKNNICDFIQVYQIANADTDSNKPVAVISSVLNRNSDLVGKGYNDVVERIIKYNKDITQEDGKSESSNIESTYNENLNEYEKSRLSLQSKISYDVDKNVYDKVFRKYEKLIILDVGCAEGNQIYDRLDNIKDFLVIGIDIDDEMIKKANEKYCNNNGKFYSININKKDFTDKMLDIMSENGIKGFNVVNISMLFTHLKYEEISNFLHRLHRLIDKDSTIIINEYENSLCWVYPDINNNFQKIFEIIKDDSDTGNGNVGRMIYKLLVDNSYSRINLEVAGYPYLNRDVCYRDDVFDMEFGFLVDDMEKLCEKYPNEEKYKKNLLWLNENIEKARGEFIKPDFLYFSGYFIFTAQK